MGHTDARMTRGAYAQLLKFGPGNVECLEAVVGCQSFPNQANMAGTTVGRAGRRLAGSLQQGHRIWRFDSLRTQRHREGGRPPGGPG